VSVSETVLSAEGLKVELGGAPVLDIPSFYMKEKEVLAIVGPNGSGKTTLLLALACLLKPVAGRISHRGEPLGSHDAAFWFRRKISMVFQEPLLFDTTVFNNVASGLKIRGLSKTCVNERVMKYLRCFQCDHLVRRSARKLSGGESQRISLARAFAIEPEIIFLDEPFSSLDPPTRHGLIHDLNKIVKETGTTTVMVTHLESEALSMSSRIMVMNAGRIIQAGSPSEVMNNPSNEFVAKFAGMENILNGRVLHCSDGLMVAAISDKKLCAAGRAQPDDEVAFCIRPENVGISIPNPGESGRDKNVFIGRITQVYSVGPFLKLILDCGFPLIALMPRDAFAGLKLAEDDEVYAWFSPASVHVLHRNMRGPT